MGRKVSSGHLFLDGFHPLHRGHFLLEYPLNAHLQGHLAHGASPTRSGEAELHDSVVAHVNKFRVAAVGLELWADDIERCLDLFPQYVSPFSGLFSSRLMYDLSILPS